MTCLDRLFDLNRKLYSAHTGVGFGVISSSKQVGGPITIDGATQTSTGTTGTTDSINITVASNTNRILLALISQRAGGTSVTSVKEDTTDFTLAQHFDIGLHGLADIWYLVAPDTGALTIDLVLAGAGSDFGWGVMSLYNVDQSSPIGDTAGQGDNSLGSMPSGTITPTFDGSMIIDVLGALTDDEPVESLTSNFSVTSSANDWTASQYDLTPTISSSNSMSWSGLTGGWTFAWSGMELKNA